MNHVVPMSFWELHAAYYAIVSTCHVLFGYFPLSNLISGQHLVECLGHSGINAHLTNPCLPFMSIVGMELTVEDHDLQ